MSDRRVSHDIGHGVNDGTDYSQTDLDSKKGNFHKYNMKWLWWLWRYRGCDINMTNRV